MKKFSELVEHKAQNTGFSGVITISRGDDFVVNRGFNFRDRINSIPNNINTRFGIASGTKTFTALGILTLVEKGCLKLTTEVGEINRDFQGFIDPHATIEQLLTHTSGIYDYFDEEQIKDFDNFFVDIPWYRLTTPSDYFPLFKHKQLKFKPGQRYSYSNGGYILLGIIIEKIEGKLFKDFIEKNILQPNKMMDSGFPLLNSLPFNTAWGYLEDGKTLNIYNIPICGASDGGMYTTSGDLIKFWKRLFKYKIISSDYLNQMITPRVNLKENISYGLGIYIQKFNGQNLYYLVGSDAGVGFDCACIPERDLIIIVISNQTNGEDEIVEFIYLNLDLI
ncbi:MAG: hypothetical protein APR63_01650 [Desulfuromonas sp. SDB]|nr:MAG: hypothetical protein APR63_01650 [Desulfuromonas sp. SDB]